MATSAYVRQLNQRRIIESVVRHRRVSRAELARVSGMSQPTVSRIVDGLLAQRILMEGQALGPSLLGDVQASVVSSGRPSIPIELDRRHPRFMAIQVGVHKTRLAMVPVAIPEADQWNQEFETPKDIAHWTKKLSAACSAFVAKGVKAVIVSLPGVIDESNGHVFLSPNLRWTERDELSHCLKTLFEVPVLFVQEIRALALGHLAIEPDAGDFLLVDSGTGVGAAAVEGGRLYTGPLPLSGEIGHIPVLDNRRVCGCGLTGCIETLISRRGILASAQENGDPPTWSALMNRLREQELPKWLKVSFDAAAVAVAAALNVLGLRQVILTGCLAELPITAIEYFGNAIRRDAMWARFGSIVCRAAPRHRLAGMVSVAIDRTLLVPLSH
jgi:predicted NBD/HSP70 family sugar kinase